MGLNFNLGHPIAQDRKNRYMQQFGIIGLKQFLNGKLFLVNTLGEIIFETLILSNKTELEMKNLPKGIYFLTCKLNNTSFHGKIMKE